MDYAKNAVVAISGSSSPQIMQLATQSGCGELRSTTPHVLYQKPLLLVLAQFKPAPSLSLSAVLHL